MLPCQPQLVKDALHSRANGFVVFIKVIGRAADAIVRFALIAEHPDLTGQLRSRWGDSDKDRIIESSFRPRAVAHLL
jgi:hypothetical protein